MADYDSDSSDGEFTETNVLLGYASKDAEEDTISKLGGRPDWLDAGKPPSAALARCKVCKDIMVLLLQLNGELPDRFPTHERRLYVFACRRETCRRKAGTIRAIRGVRVWKDEGDSKPRKDERESAKPEKKQEEQPRLGEALFGANPFGGSGAGSSSSNSSNPFANQANPFSTTTTNPSVAAAPSSTSNPFSSQPSKTPTIAAPPVAAAAAAAAKTPEAALSKTFAETLAIGTTPAGPLPPPEPWPETSAQAPYPTLYLADADYETLDDDEDDAAGKLPANVQMADADAPEPSALDREAFESSMDATFQKFADRLAQNPEQVIRYEFAGAPLLYSKTDAVGEMLARRGMTRCAGCGGARTFEVQLTPNAIAELEADDVGLDGMEWGTVIVGVCEADCVPRGAGEGKAGYLEEWVGVQWEELVKNK
ncbi:putative 20S rRNA accumulation protein 4 [Escovopsis weberi]|uniref:Putative 20S rRNA accumulation protein 4 n=1 Tax=Escovopsis weberi TaxID=150374 RepID=A0A0M9VSA3_ESCWE|nr:putative 20S rRNA accumulation protein 4 [Escovopsis weberi]